MADKLITVYEYSCINKIFKGLTKAQQTKEGIAFPPFTTDIKPPEVEKGMIAVFNEIENKWEIEKDEFKRIKINTYEFLVNCNIHYKDCFICKNELVNINMANNSLLEGISNKIRIKEGKFVKTQHTIINDRYPYGIARDLYFLNSKIALCYKYFEEMKKLKENKEFKLLTDRMFDYRILKESIIHELKKIIDILIIILYSKHAPSSFFIDRKVEITSIGELFNDGKHCEIKDKIKVDLNFDKFKNLFKILNNMDNSFKHSFLNDPLGLENNNLCLLYPLCMSSGLPFHNKHCYDEINVYTSPLHIIFFAMDEFLRNFANLSTVSSSENLKSYVNYIIEI